MPGDGNGIGEPVANTALIEGVRKFAMGVRELDIDLIDRINPFSEAYAILAKAMSEESLRQVAAVHPFIAEHRQLIHKIGVTGGPIETRIAHAALDATYLLAGAEIVSTWKLAEINRTRLEALFHRIFAPAQPDLTIQDRFGHPVRPREWFLVPFHVIDEVVNAFWTGPFPM